MKITKMTLEELEQNKSWNEAVIVFTNDSFDQEREYSLEERSYKVYRDAKWFDPNKNGMSLFGDSLNGKDMEVRLDWYMRRLPSEGKRWKVEYCYIVQ